MILFSQNEVANVSIVLAFEGDPVIELEADDIRCFVSKNGQTPFEYDLTGRVNEVSSTFMPGIYNIELDGATILDTEGEVILRFFEVSAPDFPFNPYLVKGSVYTTDLSGIDATTASTMSTVESNENTVNAIKSDSSELLLNTDDIKGTGFNRDIDSLKNQRDVFDIRIPSEVAKLSDLENAGLDQASPTGVGLWDVLGDGSISMVDLGNFIRKVLGLVHENFVITNQSYDSNNNLLGATVKIYESASDAQDDINDLAQYTINATYDSSGRLIDYKMLLDN